MPNYMFNKNFYPDYLLGGDGYVMSMNAATKLYDASMKTPLLHFEDVFLTGKLNNENRFRLKDSMTFFCIFIGLCAEKAQITPKNYHLFMCAEHKRLCEFRGMIAVHMIKAKDMKNVTTSNVRISAQITTKLSV